MGKRSRYRRRKLCYRRVIFLSLLLCAVVSLGYAVYRHSSAKEGRPAQKAIPDIEIDPVVPGTVPAEPGDGVVMPEIDPDGTGHQTGGPLGGDADGPYVFGAPVPESGAVEDQWFADAVFLGDSRTEGLQLYSGIRSGTFFWNDGISVFHVDDTKHRKFLVNGQQMTMMEALATGTWSKVYIMIGTNDLGYQVSSYEHALSEMVDHVLELQPDAVIYLQTMPPVNDAQAKESGLGSYVNNANVTLFNEAIVRVAAEKHVALVDVAECLRSEAGDLSAQDSSDGVHFRRAGYETWLEYLQRHTLDEESYWSSREAALAAGANGEE